MGRLSSEDKLFIMLVVVTAVCFTLLIAGARSEQINGLCSGYEMKIGQCD